LSLGASVELEAEFEGKGQAFIKTLEGGYETKKRIKKKYR